MSKNILNKMAENIINNILKNIPGAKKYTK
jgi:hypothetical protein